MLEQGVAPVQVRYADGERERLGSDPALPFCKIVIGCGWEFQLLTSCMELK